MKLYTMIYFEDDYAVKWQMSTAWLNDSTVQEITVIFLSHAHRDWINPLV